MLKHLLLLAALSLLPFSANAEGPKGEPIRIGDISSYTAGPSYQVPYRKGWQMAVDEINKLGGVLGRPLEYVSRDDMGKPDKALRIAQDLLDREHVLWLTGSGFANVELALSEFARVNKVLYFAAGLNGDAFIWQKHHAYAFRLGGPPPYESNAMLAEKLKSRGPLKWVNVSPNYEWGHANWNAFKEQMAQKAPGTVFIAEQWPEANKLKAAETIQALSRYDFDALYIGLFGHDLLEFLRESQKRGLLKDRLIVSLSAGMHDILRSAKTEMPKGIVTFGYPSEAIQSPPAHKRFIQKYTETYGETPDYMAMMGYAYPYFVKALIEKIGMVDVEKMRAALPGFSADTILNKLTIRAIDHQSTMGAWIGETDIVNGEAKVVNWTYEDASRYFPSDAYIEKLRK